MFQTSTYLSPTNMGDPARCLVPGSNLLELGSIELNWINSHPTYLNLFVKFILFKFVLFFLGGGWKAANNYTINRGSEEVRIFHTSQPSCVVPWTAPQPHSYNSQLPTPNSKSNSKSNSNSNPQHQCTNRLSSAIDIRTINLATDT